MEIPCFWLFFFSCKTPWPWKHSAAWDFHSLAASLLWHHAEWLLVAGFNLKGFLGWNSNHIKPTGYSFSQKASCIWQASELKNKDWQSLICWFFFKDQMLKHENFPEEPKFTVSLGDCIGVKSLLGVYSYICFIFNVIRKLLVFRVGLRRCLNGNSGLPIPIIPIIVPSLSHDRK